MKVRELWSFRDQAVTRIDLTGFDLDALDGPIGKAPVPGPVVRRGY